MLVRWTGAGCPGAAPHWEGKAMRKRRFVLLVKIREMRIALLIALL